MNKRSGIDLWDALQSMDTITCRAQILKQTFTPLNSKSVLHLLVKLAARVLRVKRKSLWTKGKMLSRSGAGVDI